MKSMKVLVLLLTAALPLAACGDDAASMESEGTTSDEDDDSDPSGSPSTTVNPSTSTTTMDPTTTTTMDPTTTGDTATTMEPSTTADTATTMEPSTTADTETTMEPTTTADTETTMEPSTTGPTTTTADTDTGGPGDGYENCFPDDTVCGASGICAYAAVPGTSDHGVVCALQGCDDAADCPDAPATGDAVVTCEDILGAGGLNDCYLSCAAGETCPDGMHCAYSFVCLHDLEWTCDITYYGDLECDCGCGAFDAPDCVDMTVDSCESCDDPHSCSAEACPGSIDADMNWLCG